MIFAMALLIGKEAVKNERWVHLFLTRLTN